jgi:hypothetical protein
MGLMWTRTHLNSRWTGCGTNGIAYAMAFKTRYRWDVFITPHGCGDPKGLWFYGAWPDLDDATDVADRFVVAYVDGLSDPLT